MGVTKTRLYRLAKNLTSHCARYIYIHVHDAEQTPFEEIPTTAVFLVDVGHVPCSRGGRLYDGYMCSEKLFPRERQIVC